MPAGLTPVQRTLFDWQRCPNGHRFDGVNYPTPEGQCPLCAWPEVRDELTRYQRLLAEQHLTVAAPRHPSFSSTSERLGLAAHG
jgi:hypothetical protein